MAIWRKPEQQKIPSLLKICLTIEKENSIERNVMKWEHCVENSTWKYKGQGQ